MAAAYSVDVDALCAATPRKPRCTALLTHKYGQILAALRGCYPAPLTVTAIVEKVPGIKCEGARAQVYTMKRRGLVVEGQRGAYALTPDGVREAEYAICAEADTWKERYEKGQSSSEIAYKDRRPIRLVRAVLRAQGVKLRGAHSKPVTAKDLEEWKRLYVKERMPIRAIAKKCGRSPSTVRAGLKREKVQLRSKSGT